VTPRALVGAAAGVAIAVAVVSGLVVAGAPSEARAQRLDERRVDELIVLSRDVDVYWSRHDELPSSLDEVTQAAGLGQRRTDPATGTPYEYRRIDAAQYELCATFESDEPARRPTASRRFWAHGVGRQCFTIEPARVGPTSNRTGR
jgi:hypothetical protein